MRAFTRPLAVSHEVLGLIIRMKTNLSFRAFRLLRDPFVDHRQHHHTNAIPVHHYQGCSMRCQPLQLI